MQWNRSSGAAGLMAAVAMMAACGSGDSVAPTTPEAEVASRPVTAAMQGGGPDFVPGEILVQFREGTTDARRAAVLRAASATALERISTAAMRQAGKREGLTVIRTTGQMNAVLARLKSDDAVAYAEPNWIYQHSATSNDSYFTSGALWGMAGATTTPANQFGSAAAAAWAANKTDCSAVYVGIIDEGYYYEHEDLAANAAVNPGEVAGNGVDDDGNGLVDDVYGYDFASGDASVFDGADDDHGTHVAGTIGGVGGNGVGVAGVCWQVKLLNAKFLGRRGGSLANAVKAIDYFTDLKTRHNLNIVATNNSWGGGGFSQALEDAIERANAAGILFIAAAGNSAVNCETGSCFPAAYANDNVIAVAAITSTGALSSFSNYGSTTIDIGAAGSGVWSTVPRSSRGRISSGYASYNGTSMATPHVAGAAALYKALNPSASAAQVKNAILSTAVPTASLAGRVATGGRLNVSTF